MHRLLSLLVILLPTSILVMHSASATEEEYPVPPEAEVKDGVAAVVFEDAKALDYCDVRPLLRVAERKALFDEAEEP